MRSTTCFFEVDMFEQSKMDQSGWRLLDVPKFELHDFHVVSLTTNVSFLHSVYSDERSTV